MLSWRCLSWRCGTRPHMGGGTMDGTHYWQNRQNQLNRDQAHLDEQDEQHEQHHTPEYLGRVEDSRASGCLASHQEHYDQFRLTVECAPTGIAHVAPDGRWRWVNDRLCAIIGYTRDELLARTFQDITYPDDLPD